MASFYFNGGYANIVHSYRDSNGKSRRVQLKSLGYYLHLSPDKKIAQQIAKEIWADELKIAQTQYEIILQRKNQQRQIIVDKYNQANYNKGFNYSYFLLQYYYQKLNLDQLFNHHQQSCYSQDSNIKLNSLVEFLVYSRCTNLASQGAEFEKINSFLGVEEINQLDDLTLRFQQIAEIREDVFYTVSNQLHELFKKNYVIYYDCCNINLDAQRLNIGLFIDSNGIPIRYDLYRGTKDDVNTLGEVINKIININKSDLSILDKNNEYMKLSHKNNYPYVIGFKLKKKMAKSLQTRFGKEIFNIDHFKSIMINSHQCLYKELNLNLSNLHNSRLIITFFSLSNNRKKEDQLYECLNYTNYYAFITNDKNLNIEKMILDYEQSDVEYNFNNLFKNITSNINARPKYIYSSETIEGHLLICFISTLLNMLIFRICKQAGHNINWRSLLEIIKEAKLLKSKDKDIYTIEEYDDHNQHYNMNKIYQILGFSILPNSGKVKDIVNFFKQFQ